MINNIKDNNYPDISDELLKRLKEDFPDTLPQKYVDSYELGVLIGQQQVIKKLELEKNYNENAHFSD